MEKKYKITVPGFDWQVIDIFCGSETCQTCPLDEMCTNYMEYTNDDKIAKLLELGVIEEVEEDANLY